jgi:sulfopyruvate decarboxylase subunit alpha
MNLLFEEYQRTGGCIFASREEEAVAMGAGLVCGGCSAVVLMQQSGIGNCLNAYSTLVAAYEIELSIIAIDRGLNAVNLVQRVSSAHTRAILNAIGCAPVSLQSAEVESDLRNALRSHNSWIFFCMIKKN